MAEDAAEPPAPAPTPSAPSAQRPGYRGRCLYKTGKCANERALKTSGAAHNLCDEHRNRQNQHQRKLDAKNRVSRRDKRGGKPAARFAPYPAAASAAGDAKKRSASLDAGEAVAVAPAAPQSAASQSTPGLHGLVLAPGQHHAASGDAAVAAAVTAVAAAANSAGMVFLPNGPQPPVYPLAMHDFDGIVVPLPSYLEGQERVEFRARIYQKVLDFISEECILRFSSPAAAALLARAGAAAERPAATGDAKPAASAVANAAAAVEAPAAAASPHDSQDPGDSADAPMARQSSSSATDSDEQESEATAAAAEGGSANPETPSSGPAGATAAAKRSKRSARP